jgi:hypothetical protein
MTHLAIAKSPVIVIGPDNNIQEPNKGFCRPNGNAIFVVQNEDSRPHRVRVPHDRFTPAGARPGPHLPFDRTGEDSTVVEANDTGIITLKAKDLPHFSSVKNPTYKYTIVWSDLDGSNERELDPDFEINN